jgi:glutathione S-transferase
MYKLWYWPEIPGRGEFVRLALEAGGIAYRDCARSGGDMMADLQVARDRPPFAPPYLIAGRQVIGQTANILLFLGEAHGLAPRSTSGRLWVNQVQLTISDAVAEAHDVHHPVDSGAYYQDQKPEAMRRAAAFRSARMPKYLGWFEQTLERQGEWLGGGRRWSYADLSLFQLIEGLSFAFPKRMARLARSHQRVMALHKRVAALPELADYLSSDRRVAFGDGIFRHYPELDGP